MAILTDYAIKVEVISNETKVFKALNEGLSTWWGAISNGEFKLNGQFTITFENGYWWTFKIMVYQP